MIKVAALLILLLVIPAYASHIQSDLDLWVSCVCTRLLCTCTQADGDVSVIDMPPEDPSLPPSTDPWVVCVWMANTSERCYAKGEQILPELPEQLPPP